MGLIRRTDSGFEIVKCAEKPLFKRAVLKCLSDYGVRDYTFGNVEALYNLQFSGRGKKYEFGGYTAVNEGDKIAVCDSSALKSREDVCPYSDYFNHSGAVFFGQPLYIGSEGDLPELKLSCQKTLRFDPDKIPPTAVVRFMREGDRFEKFGGGTKNLGSFFTDLKIPQRIRARVPVVADGRDILIVCGVEISRKVKSDEGSLVAVCVATDYAKSRK